jgi:hypothetical protein
VHVKPLPRVDGLRRVGIGSENRKRVAVDPDAVQFRPIYGVRMDLEMVIYVNIRIVPSIGSVGRLDNTTSSLAVAQYHVFISIIISLRRVPLGSNATKLLKQTRETCLKVQVVHETQRVDIGLSTT